MKKNQAWQKTGYLNNEIEFFYLNDTSLSDIDFHYHEFHKIIFLLHGKLDYHVEGKVYELKENDIVIVPAKILHKPVLKPCDYYERLIIYVSDNFLRNNSSSDIALNNIFEVAANSQAYVLSPSLYTNLSIGHIISELIDEIVANRSGSQLMKNLYFLESIAKLNRAIDVYGIKANQNQNSDSKIFEIVDYINSHLNEDLSIDTLSSKFYVSRYYLMHRFKDSTGYTLGNFISTKRIIYAKELIDSGMSMTDACFSCGYNSYSSFYRAYKKERKNLEEPLQIL